MRDLLIRAIETTIKRYPAVLQHLSEDVFEVMGLKTYDYMLANISRMVSNVYTGNMGGEFVDILGALIRGQIRQAYTTAYAEAGFSDALPSWLQADMELMQTETASFDFIYQYYRDIIDARVDGLPLQPLLDRVPLWANRYNEAVSRANMTIQAQLGGRLMWKLGATEEHCTTCAALNGIVAFASEWELSGVRPQGAPNDRLECGGWKCDCSLEPTDRRRSPKAWDRIMGIEAKHYGPGDHPGTGTPQTVHGGGGGGSGIWTPKDGVQTFHVFHGTNRKFETFDISKAKNFHSQQSGIDLAFFSENEAVASTYGKNIIEADIQMNNPLIYDANGKEWIEVIDEVDEEFTIYESQAQKDFKEYQGGLIDKYGDEFYDAATDKERAILNEKAKAADQYRVDMAAGNIPKERPIPKYDGIIILNVYDHGIYPPNDEQAYNPYTTVYAVTDNNQITITKK